MRQFQVSTRRTGIRRVVKVRVYDTVALPRRSSRGAFFIPETALLARARLRSAGP